MSRPLLQTRGLGKDYGAHTALVGLDLEVAEGEIFGLLGPNGAGKTTAISMIAGVVTPSRGSVRVAGHELSSQPFQVRREIGLVPQDLALYEDLTPRQNLAFFGRLYGLQGRELNRSIDWALEVAGLADRACDVVKRFSGGMKRRLNIAAGLLHSPRLLVLDEPTVGVDPQSRNFIFETIRALRRDHSMTVLYTSHYMEEVEALCERVAIVDHGDVVAIDEVEALLAAHAASGIEVELVGDVPAALAAVEAFGEASAAGRRLRVVTSESLAPVVSAIESTGCRITAVRSMKGDLETVFLSLTGHSLRDA